MIRVYFALAILLILAAGIFACGILVGSGLSDIRSTLKEDDMDPAGLSEKWKKLSPALEWIATRSELDLVEEDLAILAGYDPDEREYRAAKDRLDRSFQRLHDGFVPSVSGVF